MLRLLSDPRYAPIEAALRSLRGQFGAALDGGPDGNAVTVGPTDVRVDQVRGIAAMAAQPDCWTEREGRQLVRNDDELCRLYLGYVVGRSRLFSAAEFVDVLAILTEGGQQLMRSDDLAMFINLGVAEPRKDPARELPIWVTVAHKLATARDADYFVLEIPELLTGHDPLHAEIPDGAEDAGPLLPQSETPLEPTLRRYEARLLSEVLPGATGPFAAHRDDLEAYVGEHVLSPVLARTAAS